MISIVILTHDSADFIPACLDSLLRQKGEAEIIVVDNGSRDDTRRHLRSYAKDIFLIANPDNLGPCRGRNQGISAAKGEWVLTLDCDVLLEDGFIAALEQKIRELGPRTGMVQPKILTPDKKRIYSCGVYLSWGRRFFDIGQGEENRGNFSRPEFVFGACAAAALYRRSMLEEIKESTGYFDERFFFFVEDVDISWRARRKGWQCLFAPEIVCTHAGKSTMYDRDLQQYYCARNRFYTIRKNEGIVRYLAKVFPPLFYDLPRAVYLFFRNRYIRRGYVKKDILSAARTKGKRTK